MYETTSMRKQQVQTKIIRDINEDITSNLLRVKFEWLKAMASQTVGPLVPLDVHEAGRSESAVPADKVCTPIGHF